MLLDAGRTELPSILRTEICIVGAGAAGITLARELAGRGHQVVLLESGGLRARRKTQELLAGTSEGTPGAALDESRLACLGGTTGAWAGWCRPLDSVDFEEREWVAHSGWPFTAGDLEPFYRRAHEVCGLGPFEYDPGQWAGNDGAPVPLDGSVRTVLFQFSAPLNFGEAYRAELTGSPTITVLLHATAVSLEVTERGNAVAGVRLRRPNGRETLVQATVVVLAGGGVENPRLLLDSDHADPSGLGNRYGLVGRFFMDHPYVNVGVLRPSSPAPSFGFYGRHRVTGPANSGVVIGVFTLDEEVLRRERLLNSSIFLRPAYRGHPVFDSTTIRGVESLVRALQRGYLLRGAMRKLAQGLLRPDRLALAAWLRLGIGAGPRLGVRACTEPVPDPRNRVTLTADRDDLGRRRPRVEWMPGEQERRSLDRALELLDGSLRAAGLGRLELSPTDDPEAWPTSLSGVCHHMGTTRMHPDPRQGVVDAHCRVHGLDNLFVAGSSVFPTAGSVNPTLTIVALALRLAARVDGRMREGMFPS